MEWGPASTGETLTDWETVGQVAIDSGSCWLGDPSYVLHRRPAPDLGHDYREFARRQIEREAQAPEGAAQFMRDGQDGFSGVEPAWSPLGVAVRTGYGDGIYPVQVRRTAEGRIAEVRVVFIGSGR